MSLSCKANCSASSLTGRSATSSRMCSTRCREQDTKKCCCSSRRRLPASGSSLG
ncbi:Uncharacterised protein [Mycobacteroides abscessus subsp. abscessus]|nr:Uncharacterised protein [Mycobacteroides abscessus subsp. abscessus]